MNMLDTFVKPMHREGYRFVAIFAAITLVLFWLWDPLGWLGVGATVWCYYFFRDPKRQVPQGAGLLVSSADGVVSLIERAVPPEELGVGNDPLMRVSVFMSVFNCHVNRAPVAGRIIAKAYRPGTFLNASLDKASTDNERMSYALELQDGRRIIVVQIAGLVARRIVSFVDVEQGVRTGERIGLIRFGSRVDIYLPDGVEPQVALGQTTLAGETVIAALGQDLPRRLAKLE
jgi:phosphatidylserine decarboxylase